MVLSTRESASELGGGLAPSSDAAAQEFRAHGPRDAVVGTLAGRPSSLWRDAWRRLLRNKLAVAGGLVVLLLVAIALLADVLAPYAYTKTNFGRLNEGPTSDHWLGTDPLGRDMLSRIVYGARVSMLVGLGAQVIVVLIGVPMGALAGWAGGRVDTLLTRFIDVMYAFPALLLIILLMAVFRTSFQDQPPGTLGFALEQLDSSIGGTRLPPRCLLPRRRTARGPRVSREDRHLEASESVPVLKRFLTLSGDDRDRTGNLLVARHS